MIKRILFLTFLLSNYFIYSQQWESIVEMDNKLFPSYILAISNSSNDNYPNNNYIGDKNGLIGIKLYQISANTKIKLEIPENDIMYNSSLEKVIEKDNNFYFLFPKINYKYDQLRDIIQQKPINIVYKLYINDEYKGQKTLTINIRPLEECPFGFYNHNQQYNDTSWMFSAYVNENSPLINNILSKALSYKIVNSFFGYQGSQSDVHNQVKAIWFALQKDNVKYSSITNTSLSSNKVFAQRVRLIEQSYNFSQANCVDGSVLLASLLRAIGIDTVLIKIPGHMFLGYYLDRNHSAISYLETTMIGNININSVNPNQISKNTLMAILNANKRLSELSSFQIGRTPTEKAAQIENQKNYIKALENQAIKEMSDNNFNQAVNEGNRKYNENLSRFSSDSNYQIIDIAKSRAFVQPVWR